MRRSAYVFAPVLAATAASVLSGCHRAKVREEPAPVRSKAAAETRRGGFGASFNPVTLWVVTIVGVVAFALRSDSAGG